MKVYIGNLATAINESDIEQLLTDIDTPTSINVIKDRYTGQSRGFAFVEFSNQSKGNEAIRALDGQNIQGKTLTASEAREKRDTFSHNRN